MGRRGRLPEILMMTFKGNMSPWRGSVKCKEAAVAVGRETSAGGAPLKTGGIYGATPWISA
jgi:hypothetical protein